MKNDIVSLTKVDEDLPTSIAKALDSVNFRINGNVKSVFIKVNLCYYWNSLTGYTTDPQLVAGVIDVLRGKYGLKKADIKIVESDATAMRTSHVFKMLEYDKLAEEKEVTLFNLSDDKQITKKTHVNGKEVTFKIPESLVDADLLINMPKMKIMSDLLMTCALKNMFGCIAAPRKIRYHPNLKEAIVGINKILKPHLTIVDGLVALSRLPVRMDVIVAGLNPFSVDWVVSKIMGYTPSQIRYLKLATREGLGNSDRIVIDGEALADVKKMFPHVNAFSLRWQNKIQLRLLKIYSKIVGDVIPPFLET